jgi:hypothetical protein
MHLSRSTHSVLSSTFFGLGSVWAVAGAFKLLFGVRLTFPLLPPIGLERVSPLPSLAVAAGCFALAAWLGRLSRSGSAAISDNALASTTTELLSSTAESMERPLSHGTPPSEYIRRQPNER